MLGKVGGDTKGKELAHTKGTRGKKEDIWEKTLWKNNHFEERLRRPRVYSSEEDTSERGEPLHRGVRGKKL